MTPAQRSEVGTKAAAVRWGKKKPKGEDGVTTPIPPEPPVAAERSQNGTHGQGFANAAPKTGAPLTAVCRSAVEYGATGGSDGMGKEGLQ